MNSSKRTMLEFEEIIDLLNTKLIINWLKSIDRSTLFKHQSKQSPVACDLLDFGADCLSNILNKLTRLTKNFIINFNFSSFEISKPIKSSNSDAKDIVWCSGVKCGFAAMTMLQGRGVMWCDVMKCVMQFNVLMERITQRWAPVVSCVLLELISRSVLVQTVSTVRLPLRHGREPSTSHSVSDTLAQIAVVYIRSSQNFLYVSNQPVISK